MLDNKTIRSMIVLALAVALCLTMTACGKKAPQAATTDA